jgi:hypothetical protein
MALTRVTSPLSPEMERLVQTIIGCCLDVHTAWSRIVRVDLRERLLHGA